MVKNRLIALLFRLFAAACALWGIILGSGFNSGIKRLLFYTQQSNLLVFVLFVCLCVFNIVGLFRFGIKGSACYLPRFSHGCALVISYTLIIFWCFLAPFSQISLLSVGNLLVHAITPVLCILNCVLFCKRGQIKKRDIILWPLMPCVYVAFSLILGFLGVEFYVYNGVSRHFPYFFMDFELVGGYAILFILLIGASFVLLSALIYRLDTKLTKYL